jgi:hypothetical protein
LIIEFSALPPDTPPRHIILRHFGLIFAHHYFIDADAAADAFDDAIFIDAIADAFVLAFDIDFLRFRFRYCLISFHFRCHIDISPTLLDYFATPATPMPECHFTPFRHFLSPIAGLRCCHYFRVADASIFSIAAASRFVAFASC